MASWSGKRRTGVRSFIDGSPARPTGNGAIGACSISSRHTAPGARREAVLIAELEVARAKIRDLRQRVFGRKSERGRCVRERAVRPCVTRTSRGQKPAAVGHGRTMQTHLPQRSERVELDAPQCPQCGLELVVCPGTGDSEVLDIEVQACRRVIRRQRYQPRWRVAACRASCRRQHGVSLRQVSMNFAAVADSAGCR